MIPNDNITVSIHNDIDGFSSLRKCRFLAGVTTLVFVINTWCDFVLYVVDHSAQQVHIWPVIGGLYNAES
jgi:hypothetical protein